MDPAFYFLLSLIGIAVCLYHLNDVVAKQRNVQFAQGSAGTAPPATLSVEDRLRQLTELRLKEFITDDEFQERRHKILEMV